METGSGSTATPRAAPATTACRPGVLALALGALLIAWSATAAGCAGGGEPEATARRAVLYVANGRDGTVTRLDAASGQALGAPLPAGEAPWQVAVGPGGALLVLPVTPRAGARLTYVTPDRHGPGGGRARPVDLEPGARAPLLAGAGRYAVIAYEAGDTPLGQGPRRCRLVAFDLATGRLGVVRDVCRGPETVVGLAVGARGTAGDEAPEGTLVYLAFWRRPVAGGAACGGGTGSRVVAQRLDSGAPVAAAPLAGVPGQLVLASAPGRLGQRLYAVEAIPAGDVAVPGQLPTDCRAASYEEQFAGARSWRVWGLDATTLAPEAASTVSHPIRALAVTPDGDDAFVLTDPASVLRLAPAGGQMLGTTALPEVVLGLAATDDRLYTLDARGDRVWGLDRRRGALVQTLATGRGPTGLVLAGGSTPGHAVRRGLPGANAAGRMAHRRPTRS